MRRRGLRPDTRFEGRARRGNGGVDVRSVGRRYRGDQFTGGGIDRVECRPRNRSPVVSVDENLGTRGDFVGEPSPVVERGHLPSSTADSGRFDRRDSGRFDRRDGEIHDRFGREPGDFAQIGHGAQRLRFVEFLGVAVSGPDGRRDGGRRPGVADAADAQTGRRRPIRRDVPTAPDRDASWGRRAVTMTTASRSTCARRRCIRTRFARRPW